MEVIHQGGVSLWMVALWPSFLTSSLSFLPSPFPLFLPSLTFCLSAFFHVNIG